MNHCRRNARRHSATSAHLLLLVCVFGMRSPRLWSQDLIKPKQISFGYSVSEAAKPDDTPQPFLPNDLPAGGFDFALPTSSPTTPQTPDVLTQTRFASTENAQSAAPVTHTVTNPSVNTFKLGYDRGLLLDLKQKQDTFRLKANLRMQFRGSSFSADTDSWTDNAGIIRPVQDRQGFDTERARFILSGHAFDPRLKFFLQLDGDHDGGHFVDFFDYWWGWKFTEQIEFQFGKRKVAAGRNWLLGAFDTRMADRSFSADFFRPGRSVGVWLVGNPSKHSHWEIAASDGYRTDNLSPSQTNNEVAFSGTGWWDVLGEYGSASPIDFEYHCDPAVRLGYSWASSVKGSRGSNLNETDFVRLSDGTRLTDLGALAPAATVDEFDLTFAAVDAAFKYRGWSANAEYIMRWIGDIGADIPVPQSELLQHGYYVEAGTFLRPKQFEVNLQVAGVYGDFGDTMSYAAGFSWYPRKTRYLKFTVDSTLIQGSPSNSTGSDILVGDDGVLTRIQLQALF